MLDVSGGANGVKLAVRFGVGARVQDPTYRYKLHRQGGKLVSSMSLALKSL